MRKIHNTRKVSLEFYLIIVAGGWSEQLRLVKGALCGVTVAGRRAGHVGEV